MNPIVKNIIAVIAGVVVGSVVNMGLIQVGMIVVPLPEGTDASSMESLKEAMKSFTLVNFLFPFAAHALGTLAGAFVTAKVAASYRMILALVIGAWFLLGGITMVVLVGGPLWFILADLVVAYIPMAYLGGMLAGANSSLPSNQGEPT